MRLPGGIVRSCVLAWLGLTGCASEQSPYLRDLRQSWDCVETAGGMTTALECRPLPGYYTINEAWMKHLLKDLDACYAEEGRR